MSASNKKKLRKELVAAELTKKQQQERKEAQKLKNISLIFTAVMLAIVLIAGGILVYRAIDNSGVMQKKNIAATVGDHELNVVQVNYYFNDYVKSNYQQWYSSYGDYVSMYMLLMGLDLSAPLDDQIYDEETKETWADYFLYSALNKAQSDYILYEKAMATEGFALTEEQQNALDSTIAQLELYALYYGYESTDDYLRALYGNGSDLESYKEYAKIVATASAYYTMYKDSLSYDEVAIREYEKDKYNNYLSFNYSFYYVNYTDYLTGGTKDENGNTTYTEAEKDAARQKVKEIAEKLFENKDEVALNKAIANLEINKGNESAGVQRYDRVSYDGILKAAESWLLEEGRKTGDVGMVPNEVTTKDAEGNETKVINGYYLVVFHSIDKNDDLMVNVRHLLVKCTGGSTDVDGSTVYSEAEKAVARTEAERLLKVWQEGAATEETFINLVKEYSDDNAEAGGLYEDI
ncbi:MAG: hypothetical protein IKZ30_04345, partial [Oscillospiraceae bacterium]|nr:hypothetical protein [Oscillospiraceae bacterium]